MCREIEEAIVGKSRKQDELDINQRLNTFSKVFNNFELWKSTKTMQMLDVIDVHICCRITGNLLCVFTGSKTMIEIDIVIRCSNVVLWLVGITRPFCAIS